MHPREKISKSSWTLHESVKDVVTTNLVSAIHSGQLKIEAASVEKLLALIAASADEGYQKGNKIFLKCVDSSLAESTHDAEFATPALNFEPKKTSLSKKK